MSLPIVRRTIVSTFADRIVGLRAGSVVLDTPATAAQPASLERFFD
jgi:ABC-type phosphate/phosphonate transport system ATPase subunit